MRQRLLCLSVLNLAFALVAAETVGQGLLADSASVSIELSLSKELQETRQLELQLQEALQDARRRLSILESRLQGHENNAGSGASLPEVEDPLSQVLENGMIAKQRQLTESSAVQQNSGSASSCHAAGGSSGGSGGHGEHHHHQHDALVYLILVLIIGTGFLHLSTLPPFKSLPYTVVLFVLGMLCSVFYKSIVEDNPESFGIFARSYEMWMDINPHLLIFTMLPVLLTGDAMTLDTSVAKRVASQCLWLAGPGVLFGSFATATFLWLYLKWDFLLCLATGSILAATDPVAVVGLLKELGASPTLTVQIQGESLLNDGTAMVLFNVAYGMLEGEEHDAKSIFLFLVYMVGCSWFLGAVIGGMFSSWIQAAGKRLEHHSSMIQISLTICCAYGSFVFAEGVIGISGVLSTVAAALVLADTMWIKIVNETAMHEVWHTLEYLGNTLIFFLAGALGGRSLWLIDAVDVLHLLVIYVVLVILRMSVMLGSRPILKLLSPDKTPVSAADAVVMAWGGLRGAVGLALAIHLMRDKAGGNIDDAKANKVFFFTAGIAFLTLIVNATTCPSLVNYLGIAACPESKFKVLRDIVQRLVETCENEEAGAARDDALKVLDHVMHHLHNEKPPPREQQVCRPGSEIVEDFRQAKEAFMEVSESDKIRLGWHNGDPLLEQEAKLVEITLGSTANSSMVRTITESLLALVRHELWDQIQQGEFVEGTKAPEVLLSCNIRALHHVHSSLGLTDFEEIERQLGVHATKNATREGNTLAMSPSRSLSKVGFSVQHDTDKKDLRQRAKQLVNKPSFQGFITMVILCNAVTIFLGDSAGGGLIFLLLDCCFLAVYVFEFVVKILVYRAAYFKDGWNALDFICMILGIFGVVTEFLVEAGVLSSMAISSEMMLIRLGRVFKLMRVLRLVSLAKFSRMLLAKLKGEQVASKLGAHLEVVFTVGGFVQAHLNSHKKFLLYFGAQSQRRDSKSPDDTPAIIGVEQARCILESWTAVYRAVVLGSLEIEYIDSHGDWILGGLSALRESVVIAQDLANFVLNASDNCVILPKDAETIIHPIYDHLNLMNGLFGDIYQGVLSEAVQKRSKSLCPGTDVTGVKLEIADDDDEPGQNDGNGEKSVNQEVVEDVNEPLQNYPSKSDGNGETGMKQEMAEDDQNYPLQSSGEDRSVVDVDKFNQYLSLVSSEPRQNYPVKFGKERRIVDMDSFNR